MNDIMNSTSNVQIFSYLFVLDFGATVFDPQEIIEIACLKVGTKSKQVEDSFRQYVRPKYCGRLNGVTMNITGVRQEMVSSAPRFRVAWMKFMNWYLAAKGNHTVAFLTVDSFPINMHLRCQTLLSKMRPSDDFNQWIVLKKVYYKAYDFFPRNLQFMMRELKLPYQGKVENAYDLVEFMDKHFSKIPADLKEQYLEKCVDVMRKDNVLQELDDGKVLVLHKMISAFIEKEDKLNI
ncbi:unnamed protein product [Bemisia tabaci]|uniref:Exonuclease domain-containing protein n=1 Tax=Bemisia tabaci TaxID=7038 RepID=A0A9P0ALE6_BEMTA|nr:unnamed protein product [Bemisia tabaci]